MSIPEEPSEQRQRIVRMLRNLILYFEIGSGGTHIHKDHKYDEREGLLCEFASLKKIVPTLPLVERMIIRSIGIDGLTEEEVAVQLGITRQAVCKRLWSAAERIQHAWNGTPTRRRGRPGKNPGA